MNRKKIVTIIVLCLILLAAEIAFILLNPVKNSDGQETQPSTQGELETTAGMEDGTMNTTDPAQTTVQTDAPVTTAPQVTAETKAVPTETETTPTETEPDLTETEPAPTETETAPTEDDIWEGSSGNDPDADAEDILDGDTEYERYMKMSAEEQEAYFNSFESTEAFFTWYNAAKKEYEDSLGAIEVGPDTTIDLGNLGN